MAATMGYQFVPWTNGSITEVCAYVTGAHTVGIWNTSFAMLGSANVSGSGGWSCANLTTPITTKIGQAYLVGVCGGANSSGLYYQTLSSNMPRHTVDATVNKTFYQYISGCNLTGYTNTMVEYTYGVADIKFNSSNNASGVQCGVINSPGTYTLSSNLTSAGTCFTVNASSVTIDCAGYSITGMNFTGTSGVYSNQAGTIVKNCKISTYSTGVSFNAASSSTVQNTTMSGLGSGVTDTSGTGITIVNSSIDAA